MENEATRFVVVDRGVLSRIVDSLKKLDVRGYDSYDRVVGCVMLLENMMYGPPPEKKAEEKEG